ncbi:MAG: type II toxin-antitoxin system HicA family toxin [Limisphaerales bacterium]
MVRTGTSGASRGSEGCGTLAELSRRFPVCTAHEVAAVLRKSGFLMVSQRGSHQKWRHADGRQVILAMHGSKPIPIGTLKNIIQGSGIDVDEYR